MLLPLQQPLPPPFPFSWPRLPLPPPLCLPALRPPHRAPLWPTLLPLPPLPACLQQRTAFLPFSPPLTLLMLLQRALPLLLTVKWRGTCWLQPHPPAGLTLAFSFLRAPTFSPSSLPACWSLLVPPLPSFTGPYSSGWSRRQRRPVGLGTLGPWQASLGPALLLACRMAPPPSGCTRCSSAFSSAAPPWLPLSPSPAR